MFESSSLYELWGYSPAEKEIKSVSWALQHTVIQIWDNGFVQKAWCRVLAAEGGRTEAGREGDVEVP